MNKNHFYLTIILLLTAFMACSSNNKTVDNTEKKTKVTVNVPGFNADSAYQYIQAQADFGPRVPNTQAHKACGEYLAAQLEKFGAKVYNQYADLVAYDNTILKARNIIGAYNPESRRRVMLCAHWDSRPYADYDADKRNHRKPILGVNDGASGVGVLLEIARQLQQQAPSIGIDIIFFDAEDYGTPYFHKGAYKEHTWCLGSQYWGRIPHEPGDLDGGFLIDALDDAHHVFGLNNHLGGAVVVTQNQESKVGAHFTDVLQPANDGNIFSCIGKPQLAAASLRLNPKRRSV